MKATKVIAAFPGTGKSYYASRNSGVVDSDSSSFARDDHWPGNYIAHIRALLNEDAIVLVSTHREVRQALYEAGIPFTLVYPDFRLRNVYRERLEGRGSPQSLVRAVYGNWDNWIAECMGQRGCEHFVLGHGQYVSDVLEGRIAA